MEKKKPLIKLKNVTKFYYNKGNVSSGFNKISLEFYSGEFVVITGESGSGKSTLLNVIAGLDSYEEGEMYINGSETSHYSQIDFEKYRKSYIGNIFQTFNLVNSYTVYQNIELVLLLNGYKKKEIKGKVIDLIKKVDLYKYRNTRVSHLSGGQKQRVAIARALAKDTPIIIADEPTGNLDLKSAASVLKLLSEVADDKLVIVVTHNYEQVEQYATRKIEMHDGKVREDIILKKDKITDINIKEYDDITFLNKIRIGIRNTFNIIPKFTLLFLVFLFIISAFLGAYSEFKKVEYADGSQGYNWYFSNTNTSRIIVNKKDKSYFTDEELDNLSKIKNVEKVIENDVFLDYNYNINTEDYYYYFYGTLLDSSEINKVDVGRTPVNENEVVVKVYKDDWTISNEFETVQEQNFLLIGNDGRTISDDLKVVGAIYSNSYDDYALYVNNNLINKAKKLVNQSFSSIEIDFGDQKIEFLQISPLETLSKGETYVSSDMNAFCKYSWCKGKNINLNISNLYYEDSLNLTVKDIYYKYNIKALTGYKDYDSTKYTVFISKEDYDYLFNRHTYQISIFSNDSRNVEQISEDLGDTKYNILEIKNSLAQYSSSLAIVKIIKTIVLVVLFIVLFFITYFVIKLIQKSKNIYYSTVRILGGSSKVIKSFIRIELFTIYHLTYLIFIIFGYLINKEIIDIRYIKDMLSYLKILDYIYIYLILFIMSFLIANRYSRTLFKSSAMKTYREDI